MIPLPPWLLGLISPLKPLGDFLATALKNPFVIGALVALGFVFLWHVEEGRVSAAKAQVAKVDASWRSAFARERQAFQTVEGALKRQSAAVAALEAAGRAKTVQAASAWERNRKALASAQSAAANRPEPDPKGDPTTEAEAIFKASKETLP